MERKCNTCGIGYKQNSNSQKLCRECYVLYRKNYMKEFNRLYREKNKKTLKEKSLIYYQKNRLNKIKKSLKYFLENKEKIYEYRKKRFEDPLIKEKMMVYNRKYYKSSKGRKSSRKRRALKNNIIESFTITEWEEKLSKTKGICPRCNKYVSTENLALDHIHPLNKAYCGRIYTIDDVQPLCKSCNSSKSDNLEIIS